MTGTVAPSWRPVLAYTAVSAANQMLWLTYTPFTTGAARHYGVSSDAVGWLAEIFPLLYVVLAVPTGRLLDRRMPLWLGVGAVLTAAGALLRLGDSYHAALAGQVLVAIAQPFVLNAVIAVSERYLPAADRARGIAVSSAGIFAGMVLALVLGSVFGAGRLMPLLAVQAVLAVGAAGALSVSLRRLPGTHDRVSAEKPARLQEVWADRGLRCLVGLACVGFGVFVALTTWLQALLEPAGVSDDAAGSMLLVMVVAGVLGSAVLPTVLAARGRQLSFVGASIVVAAGGLLALAVAPGVAVGFVALIVIGAALLTDLPVLLDLVDRRAGAAAGTAGSLVWLAGNAAGLVLALVVQALVHHPGVAFAVQAAVLVLGVPLLLRFRGQVAIGGGRDQGIAVRASNH